MRKHWLTPAEVAAQFRVSRATVYALIRSGRIHAVRIGMQLRVLPETVAALSKFET